MNAKTMSFEPAKRTPGRNAGAGAEPVREDNGLENLLRSIRNVATLSECLRVLGAGIVLASLSLYLMQGWHDGNDVSRYLLLLMQTGLLATAGFAMSHGLKEARGARVFFGLALVSIPANFAILGALLYSMFQWDAGLAVYPAFADWRIEGLAATAATLGGALLVLLPMSAFCFAVMARRSARRLAVHFAALNLLLLFPVRTSLVTGTLALLGIGYTARAVRRMLDADPALRTAEGRFALAALYLPMAIMLVRGLYFYEIDSVLVALLAMAAFVAIRQTALFPHRNTRLRSALDAASLGVAAVVALATADSLAPVLAFGWLPPLASSAYALLGFDVWQRAADGRVRSAAVAAVSVAVATGFSLGVVWAPSAGTALLALVAGALMLGGGYRGRAPAAVTAGFVTVGCAALFGYEALRDLVLDTSWMTLAAVGASAIVAGSVLDRHGIALRQRARHWLESLAVRRRSADAGEVPRADELPEAARILR